MNEYAIELDEWGISVEYPWDAPDVDFGQWDPLVEEKEES